MNNIKKYILTGLFAILPIALTWIIFFQLYIYFSKPGTQIVKFIFKDNTPEYLSNFIGFILTLLFIYLLGLFISNYFGKKIVILIDYFISKIPIAKTIYKTIKQITTSLSESNDQAFQKVIYIEYPRVGLWTIAMVTGSSKDSRENEYYHVFVPTTPNPTSGFMLLIPKKDALETSMTVEEGLRTIISGGMIASEINNIK